MRDTAARVSVINGRKSGSDSNSCGTRQRESRWQTHSDAPSRNSTLTLIFVRPTAATPDFGNCHVPRVASLVPIEGLRAPFHAGHSPLIAGGPFRLIAMEGVRAGATVAAGESARITGPTLPRGAAVSVSVARADYASGSGIGGS